MLPLSHYTGEPHGPTVPGALGAPLGRPGAPAVTDADKAIGTDE